MIVYQYIKQTLKYRFLKIHRTQNGHSPPSEPWFWSWSGLIQKIFIRNLNIFQIRIGIGSCDLFAKLLQILPATGGGIDQISEGS